MAPQLEADADVDTDTVKVNPARKKSVSKQATAGAGEKPKTPRKRAPKKQGNSSADAEGDQVDSSEEKGVETPKPTPKKRGPKAKKIDVDGENGDADVEDGLEPATPKAMPVRKRTPKPKKESAAAGENGPSASNSSKKRASTGGAGENEGGTPSKKPRATPSKAASSKVPTTRSELTEADKLMLELKKGGKTWVEITAAVSALTGQHYGRSTLGNRYAKIIDALTEWKDGDVERMLFVREKVEQETEAAIAAFKKEAENKIWSNMAKAMVELGADEYTGGAVEKAYNREKKEGFPHRSTMAAVMSGFSSASGVNGGGGSDAETEADEADGLKAEEVDASADADTSEV
jgi:hypothetical protein